jgi:uncharacterized protein YndB with AHSA1/START domain
MRTVEHSIEIATQPSQVIKAFTEPELLKAWWGVDRSLVEKRPGGLYSLIWNINEQGMGYVSTGIVQQYEPNGLFEVADLVYFNPERAIMGPLTLRVIAKIKDGKTLLNLSQGGYLDGDDWDWFHAAASEAWPAAIQRLKAYLEADGVDSTL